MTGDEARHLKRVLRAGAGDSFYAIDGAGKKYRAVIDSVSGATVRGIITNITRLENEPFHQITVAMGICRPARMDDIVEKGTENGVYSFQFYYSDKSYSRMKEEPRSDRKITRLKKIARAAAKQSRRSLIPTIHEMIMFNEALKEAGEYDLALFAEAGQGSKPVEAYLGKSPESKKILLLVGPESGLSSDEVISARGAGFKQVSLGPRRLRAETAGMIFPALVLNHLGDL